MSKKVLFLFALCLKSTRTNAAKQYYVIKSLNKIAWFMHEQQPNTYYFLTKAKQQVTKPTCLKFINEISKIATQTNIQFFIY